MKNIDGELQCAQKELEQLTHRKDRLVSKLSNEERRKRTRRLIQRGAILESIIDGADGFTNEQIQKLLIEIFSTETAKAEVENLKRTNADNPLV